MSTKTWKILNFFLQISEIRYVDTKPTKAEGYTASQLAKLTGKTRHAIEAWLSLHRVRPLSEAIYPLDTLDKIREAKRGRPKKAKDPEQAPWNTYEYPSKGIPRLYNTHFWVLVKWKMRKKGDSFLWKVDTLYSKIWA